MNPSLRMPGIPSETPRLCDKCKDTTFRILQLPCGRVVTLCVECEERYLEYLRQQKMPALESCQQKMPALESCPQPSKKCVVEQIDSRSCTPYNLKARRRPGENSLQECGMPANADTEHAHAKTPMCVMGLSFDDSPDDYNRRRFGG